MADHEIGVVLQGQAAKELTQEELPASVRGKWELSQEARSSLDRLEEEQRDAQKRFGSVRIA